MSDQVLCQLQVFTPAAIHLLGTMAEDSASMLGVTPANAARLRTLTQEVAEAIAKEAFEDSATLNMDLAVVRSAGGFKVVLTDHGAPMDFGRGGYPPRVSDLIRLGFADGLDITYEPRQGNRAEITKHLTYASVGSDEAFLAEAEAESPASSSQDVDSTGRLIFEVRPMTPADAMAVARLFYRCYGYSAAYAAQVYEPDRMAEYVAAGRHFGTVAVTPSGRVVGHVASEIDNVKAVTGRIGLFAVDPSYRGHRVGTQVGLEHVRRLIARGIIGQFTEAVTVHLASQKSALTGGAHEVGLLLAGQTPQLSFTGFDDTSGHRRSMLMYFGSLGEIPHRQVHVPPAYQEVIERIYDVAGLDRSVSSDYNPRDAAEAAPSRLTIALSHETQVARIWVEAYGADFLKALQQQVSQLRLNRYDIILTHFPLRDPATSMYASGLRELGLSFSGVYPEYRDGDVLVLQSLNNVDFELEDMHVASEMGAYVRDVVLADYHAAADRVSRQTRSRAAMARIYEALE